jgi:5'-3' exonuclease
MLLIDADILAYKTSFSAEEKTRWDEGIWTWHADEGVAIQKAMDWIANIHEQHGEDPAQSLFCFTGKTNWRHAVMPEYKAGRKETRTPLVLPVVRDWIKAHYQCAQEEPFEADDLLGIYSQVYAGSIIVSQDKDFKQVPGRKCRDVGSPTYVVSEFEAVKWHMMQTLTGDATDGYTGCPGVGPVKAEKVLSKATNPTEMWAAVVKEYAKAGLGEQEAIRQARVAKILTTKDPAKRLWEPSHLDSSVTQAMA